MQNGWGGGSSSSQGATSLTQWPPAAPAGVIGGRGRGFVPGRGRGIGTWNSSPAPSVNNSSSQNGQGSQEVNGRVGVPHEDRTRTCFKCGATGHLSHNCPGPTSNGKHNVRQHNLRIEHFTSRDQDNERDSGISSPKDSFHPEQEKWGESNSNPL